MSGKRSRTKGHDWEREMAKKMRQAGWNSARRNLTETRGTDELQGVDVIGCDPYLIQCKRGKRPPLMSAWTELVNATKELESIPVLAIHKENGCGRTPIKLIVLGVDDFIKLAKEAK